LFVAQKLRILLRRTKDEGLIDTIMYFIDWPLTVLRDYTIPMAEDGGWDRTRASLTIMFMPVCFYVCFGGMGFF